MNNPANNLKISLKAAKISAIISAVLVPIIAVGYFLALTFDFDYDIGHFERNSPLFIITAAAIALGIALPALAALASSKRASAVKIPKSSGALTFFAAFSAAMAIFETAQSLSSMLLSGRTGKLETAAVATLPLLSVALITLAVPKIANTVIAKLAMIASIISVDLYILACYFDQTLPLNSPVRHITMLAQLAVMFFFISEARLTFGMSENNGRPTARRATFPFYIFANSACAALSLGFSAGALALELLPGGTTGLHPSYFRLAMYAAIGGVAMCRVFTAQKIAGEYTPSPIEPSAKEEKLKSKEAADGLSNNEN